MKDLILGIIILIIGWCLGVFSIWCLFAMSW